MQTLSDQVAEQQRLLYLFLLLFVLPMFAVVIVVMRQLSQVFFFVSPVNLPTG
jgi:hypothetical protein